MLLSQQRFIYSRLWFFQWLCMAVRVGLWRNLRAKEWCFWTVVWEKTRASTVNCKEIKPVNPKGNQSWIFIGRTDAEAEAPIFWLPDLKNWLLGKILMIGKTEGGGEGDVRGWDGCEFEQAPGVGDGKGSRECCSPWGHSQTRLSDWSDIQWM